MNMYNSFINNMKIKRVGMCKFDNYCSVYEMYVFQLGDTYKNKKS